MSELVWKWLRSLWVWKEEMLVECRNYGSDVWRWIPWLLDIHLEGYTDFSLRGCPVFMYPSLYYGGRKFLWRLPCSSLTNSFAYQIKSVS
ncbi:hypothetical protein MtrunA17_Chr5g0436751 [Medicago truncatula]|uniref:Uncharacterized protein n=1 Tax=Medicago truncatula TaxID=3880 RepID=A0A396HUT0_MEDTR|nr:hypothetical protein MtrunA17_Chr5g0436751 [Medicago truncatula]